MGRGVSSGGGQSSLGYLFGDDPSARRAAAPAPAPAAQPQQQPAPSAPPPREPAHAPAPAAKDLPAAGKSDSGTSLDMGQPRMGRNSNNYHRSDGQNTGNFITDRPTTKVAAAPGGQSSLNYLFGGPPPAGSK
ncbi:hypothetical protein R1sor_009822 [Riccia sorocarpa]|uniref:Uncharacterized protein n=1 Tax=Riccia sorocarpa TaxID=122646 RepID=A0ABD3HXN7_9MARC